MRNNRKITVLGAGNVGASIAYTLTLDGMCSELVLIDINDKKAQGEAMDIRQGLSFSRSVNIYAGSYEDAKDSDIVVVTVGAARRPGQSRIDLAQGNVNIIRSVMPHIVSAAPDAVYVVVSNPVDILTYAILQCTDLPASRVIGSGTLLDSSRLRSIVADRVGVVPQNVHAYVFGGLPQPSVYPEFPRHPQGTGAPAAGEGTPPASAQRRRAEGKHRRAEHLNRFVRKDKTHQKPARDGNVGVPSPLPFLQYRKEVMKHGLRIGIAEAA